MDAKRSYIEGIRQAADEGAISFYPPQSQATWGPDDLFAHLPEKGRENGFMQSNTRSFEAVGESLLRQYSGKLQLLFLGPGSGKELSDARKLQPNASITSIGFTPVHPNLHLQVEVSGMRSQLQDALRKEQNNVAPLPWQITPDNALRLQEKFQLSFLVADVEHPIANAQHIGTLHQISETLPEKTYDFIYDSFGALFYSLDEEEKEDRKIAESVVARLSEKGSLLLTKLSGHKRQFIERAASSDDRVICINKKGPTILAKAHSPLAALLRESAHTKNDHVIKIDYKNYWLLEYLNIEMEEEENSFMKIVSASPQSSPTSPSPR